MRQLVDAILYVDSLSGLVTFLSEYNPDMVTPDEDGGLPYVTGFDRTPILQNGDEALVYVRMTQEEAAVWSITPHVTTLKQLPYSNGVQDSLYEALFEDSEALAIYDSVYDRTPYTEDGVTITPPDRFGQMA